MLAVSYSIPPEWQGKIVFHTSRDSTFLVDPAARTVERIHGIEPLCDSRREYTDLFLDVGLGCAVVWDYDAYGVPRTSHSSYVLEVYDFRATQK